MPKEKGNLTLVDKDGGLITKIEGSISSPNMPREVKQIPPITTKKIEGTSKAKSSLVIEVKTSPNRKMPFIIFAVMSLLIVLFVHNFKGSQNLNGEVATYGRTPEERAQIEDYKAEMALRRSLGCKYDPGVTGDLDDNGKPKDYPDVGCREKPIYKKQFSK